MKFRLLLLHLLPLPAFAAAAADELRLGDDALANGLWQIAAAHFQHALHDLDPHAADRPRASLSLAEARIRGGKPADALLLLDDPLLASTPGLVHWRGQALAGLGDFSRAAALLESDARDPASPFRRESAFTAANLHLSLGHPDQALAILDPLLADSDPASAASARLRTIEILIDTRRLDEARRLMPAPETLPAAFHSHALFLDASLLLAAGNADAASAKFATLLAQPEGQTLARHHAAALGMADALAARGNLPAASASLLDFIQQYPESTLLKPVFERLLNWLPEKPEPNHPVIERLAQWIPPQPPPPPAILATSAAGAAGAFPENHAATELVSTGGDLAAFSLYTRAIGLHRVATPASRDHARLLFTRLLFEHPQHFLTARSLLQTGRWLIDEGKTAQALTVLDAVRESSRSPLLRGESTFLQARASHATGDDERAIALFEEAAGFLRDFDPGPALLNADLVRLHNGREPILVNLQADPETPEQAALRANIRLEQALSATPPEEAKTAIAAFLLEFPDHPRAAEARLAALEAALDSSPPDLDAAKTWLHLLENDVPALEKLPPSRLPLVRLHLADLSSDTAAAITLARSFIETFPADPAAPEATFTLGRNLFQAENYNDARLVLEKLAAADPNPDRAQAAWLLAARSAALGATPQSREEALALFDRAIAAGGSVSPIARIEKANLLIALNHLPQAIGFLRDWFNSLPETDFLRLPAGLLLGEAIYAARADGDQALAEALAVYDQLLARAADQPALLNRLQYLRGLTLEKLPQPADPFLLREDEALTAYYSVLEAAGDQPPAEWDFFEQCGFRALGLLERKQDWPGAIAVAKKIASFKGPRAQEAASRAQQIRLKHFIWEE